MDFKNKDEMIKNLIILTLSLASIAILVSIKTSVFWVLNFIISLLFPIIFGFLFAYLLWPLVKRLNKVFKVRFISIFVSYLLLIGIFTYLLIFLIPNVYNFFIYLINYDYTTLPFYDSLLSNEYIYNLVNSTSYQTLTSLIESTFSFQGVLSTVLDGVGGFVSFSTGILFSSVISVYVLLKYENLVSQIKYIFTPKSRESMMELLYDINLMIREYTKGLLKVGLINASAALVVYLVLGIDYAFSLALFLLVFYSIPFIGMLIGGLPAVILALQISPIVAIIVIIFLVVLTGVSSNIIEPHVFGTKLGVDPLIILIGILIASSIFGFVGLIIAMPLVAVTSVIFKRVKLVYNDWFNEQLKENNDD